MSHRSRLSIAIAVASLVTACSGGISKSDITRAINEEIGKEKTCFSLTDNNIRSWPLRVQRPEFQELDPILFAMNAARYLQVVTEKGNVFRPTIDVITLTEEAKRWWDVKSGFCVGSKAVADIVEWTEPGQVPAIQVKYTWHLISVPSWAKRAEFKNIPGLATPVATMAILQKTNKGWRVAG